MDRYEVRWRNGAWKIFDRHRYMDVAVFETQREAEHALARG